MELDRQERHLRRVKDDSRWKSSKEILRLDAHAKRKCKKRPTANLTRILSKQEFDNETQTLTSLKLRDFSNLITDDLMCEIAYFCGQKIRELDLSECTKLKKAGVRSLSQIVGQELRVLKMNCVNLDDEVTKVLFNGLFHLQDLALSQCPRITSITARTIAIVCRNSLTRLDFSHCSHITDEALFWISGSTSAMCFPRLDFNSFPVLR